MVYDSMGEKQKAIDFLTQALPLLRETGARDSKALTLRKIGDAYRAMGEDQKALDFYSQADAVLPGGRRQ
jgi:tetratricopeptide (TPR) repeat protein